MEWPSETKPNPENCKNCSSKCAYECAQLQYTIQHRTVLISSLLPSDNHHSSDVVYWTKRGEYHQTCLPSYVRTWSGPRPCSLTSSAIRCACSFVDSIFTLYAIRNLRAPTIVAPQFGINSAGPKSGFHCGSRSCAEHSKNMTHTV